MALHPTVKKTIILGGKIAAPLAVTFATVKLGVWGTANDSLPLTNRVSLFVICYSDSDDDPCVIPGSVVV